MKNLIKKLTEAYGPTGYEQPVRDLIREEVTPYVDSVEIDALGNLHAVKNADGDGQTIMLAAHMDEIGLMVSHVEKEGFIRFTNLGTLLPVNLVGARVVFSNGVVGVINIEDWTAKPQTAPHFKNLYIDVGVSSREECPLKVGDVAAFFGPVVDLGKRMMAKSMDNRIGCAVQIETIERLKETPHRLHFVFTVQEEVGARGSITGAFQVEPDIALALDVTLSGDMPGVKNFPVEIGKGPAIKVMDIGALTHPAVKTWIIETAETHEIPYQLEILTLGSSDARGMQIAKAGAAVGCLSVPCRHVHSPSEIVDLGDVEHAVNLLVAMLSGPTPEALQ
jgi:endoglucanase